MYTCVLLEWGVGTIRAWDCGSWSWYRLLEVILMMLRMLMLWMMLMVLMMLMENWTEEGCGHVVILREWEDDVWDYFIIEVNHAWQYMVILNVSVYIYVFVC